MKTAVLIVVAAMFAAGARAQETQADPAPIIPPATGQPVTPAPQPGAQTPAPIERRTVPRPNAGSSEPVDGPLSGAPQHSPQPAIQKGSNGEPGTIRVETRLVNVALNVVDDKNSPVGGFEKHDFQILEDGKPQTIAIFERESSSPLSIVLAVDASETVLTSARLERDAAKHFVRAILRPQDELDLMDFSDVVREIVPFTNQPKRIETGIGAIERGTSTALYDAVFLASDRLAQTSGEPGRRRVIVLISDGGDTAKSSRYTQALEEAERAGAMIYSIIIVPIASDAGRNTGGEHALIQMSEDTGGKYYYVEDPADLEPAFRHVSDDLRTQYLLGYYAPKRGADDSFRRIKVRFVDPALDAKYSLRYRSGYFADAR
jgi:Ca-activated chloride channel homolog